MALMNRRLAPEIETVFLQPAALLVCELSDGEGGLQLGGDVTGLVPPNVLKRLRARINHGS